ncbi:MAG: TSUP family transporter, partial [Spirochaetaceae bacterium]|nr:TSUP family transporter [Spirochaetaceae bacterium]
LHGRFGNVRWTFRPMSETLRLWLIIAGSGCLAVIVSVTSVYGIFKLAEKWIHLYVAILLTLMGFVSLFHSRKKKEYAPNRMVFFGALAGFNKGIGGGGYGPVITIGGILSGIPVKSMMAITALSEGTVCVVSVMVWGVLARSGTTVDFVLLPSMMIGSVFAAVMAPYAVKIVPERFWKWFVPAYSCVLALYTLVKVFVR